jgi:hypothetical protein
LSDYLFIMSILIATFCSTLFTHYRVGGPGVDLSLQMLLYSIMLSLPLPVIVMLSYRNDMFIRKRVRSVKAARRAGFIAIAYLVGVGGSLFWLSAINIGITTCGPRGVSLCLFGVALAGNIGIPLNKLLLLNSLFSSIILLVFYLLARIICIKQEHKPEQ